MSAKADAVVIGASVDGLVAAAHLAASGRDVVVLESGKSPGGICRREEFLPDFWAPGLLHDDHLVRRSGLEGLGLERHGLNWHQPPRLVVADGVSGGLSLAKTAEDMRGDLSGDDALDVGAYGHWRAQLSQWQPFVREALDNAPPALLSPTKRALLGYAQKGLALRRLPEHSLHEFLRAAAMPARDWLDEHFHHPLLRAGLVAPALTSSVLGPRSAGTGLLMLMRECAAGLAPNGGLPTLVDSLVSACRALGVEIRVDVQVDEILVNGRGVRGVRLSTGESIETLLALSAMDVRITLGQLLHPGSMSAQAAQATRVWRSRGSVAVVRLALGNAPRFEGREEEDVERCVSAESLDVLERTADALKYGEIASRVWLDIRVPSHAEPSLAPAGQHVATLLVHGVSCETGRSPAGAGEASNVQAAEARARVLELALGEFDRIAPGTSGEVLGSEVLLPLDLEQRYGLSGGHLFGGELALDQVWVRRPSLPLSRYGSGIPGLLLAGSSSHPGGPFLAAAGALAARTVLD